MHALAAYLGMAHCGHRRTAMRFVYLDLDPASDYARGGAHVFRCGRGTEAVSGGKSGMDARGAATGAAGTVDTNLRIL